MNSIKVFSPEQKKFRIAGIQFNNGVRIVTSEDEAALLSSARNIKLLGEDGKQFNSKKNQKEMLTKDVSMDMVKIISETLRLATEGKTKSQMIKSITGDRDDKKERESSKAKSD